MRQPGPGEIEYAFARNAARSARSLMPRTPSTRSTAAPGLSGADEQALPETYEAALAELELIVAQMESGAMPLDDLLGRYRRGAALLSFCRGRLQAVEDQVRLLEEGELRPWNDA
jgi:exodeoxyribonuclease VII small subunit